MIVHQAYRFALDPSPRSERALASHVGAGRFVFNWGLALVKERLEARKQDRDVKVPWTLPALRREWNRVKATVAPWWRENSKEAYASGLAGLAAALNNWAESRNGTRRGPQDAVSWLSEETPRAGVGECSHRCDPGRR